MSNKEENPEKKEKNEEMREENGRRGRKIIEEGKTYQLINQVINNNNNIVDSRDLLFLRKDNVFRRTFRRTISYTNGKPLVENFVNLYTQKLFERNEIPV